MSTNIAQFNNKVTAGTLKTAPTKFPMKVSGFNPTSLHIKVPAGPRGEVGFQITQGGQQVFPVNPGTWFIPENDEFMWPVSDVLTSGGWEMTAYNTGQYDHTIYVTFIMLPNEVPGAAAQGEPPSAIGMEIA